MLPLHLRNDPVKRSTLEASGLMTPLAIWHPTKSGGPHHCRVIPFSTTTPERCPFERFRSLVHSAGSYTTCPGRNHQPSTHSHSLEGTGQNDMRYFAGFKPEASRVERLTGSFWRCERARGTLRALCALRAPRDKTAWVGDAPL